MGYFFQKKYVKIAAKHHDALECPEGNDEVMGSDIRRIISDNS
jgi:hypothetical protein